MRIRYSTWVFLRIAYSPFPVSLFCFSEEDSRWPKDFRTAAGNAKTITADLDKNLSGKLETLGKDLDTLHLYADLWYQSVSSVFLSAYRETAGDCGFLPRTREETDILLQAFLIDKGIYELIYELNNRPDWVMIPIRGMLSILGES